MKKENKKLNRKGSILAYALIMMMVVSIILVSMLQYISSQIKLGSYRLEKEKAFQVAEAGIYYYRWYLAHNISGKTAAEIDAFWSAGAVGVMGPADFEFVDAEGGGAIGVYRLDVIAPSAGSTIITVKSTGWTYKEPDAKRTVQVRFRRPSWSEYMFLSDTFINFGDQADVYGKVHSNTGIRFDGLAHSLVTSSVASFNDPSHGGGVEFGVHTHGGAVDPNAPAYPWPDGTVPDRPDVFMGGREFPVAPVNFSGLTTDLAAMKVKAQAGTGKYFNADGEGRRIIFKNNTFDACIVDTFHHVNFSISKYLQNDGSGTCNTCTGSGTGPSGCVKNYPIVDNEVIFVENDAWVEGIVDGRRVSVVAANLLGTGDPANVYVGLSNLRYTSYSCSNIVGLIAQKDVTVVSGCPDDFVIDAAVLAQSGAVGITSNMSNKNSLTFNGAIVSYLQPFFAHSGGFAVRFYNFDNDLLYCPPPYFPTGTEYAIDQWEEL